MFENIGGKIKGFTKFVCWVGIIGSVIIGLTFFSSKYTIVTGLLIMAVGSLASWIGSFIMYGFGELVESAMETRDMLRRTDGNIIRKDITNKWFCSKCGQENTNVSSQCKSCGQYRS